MKRILYIITKSNWGGAQRYVFELATSLPKDQFEVTVAFGGHGPLERRLKEAGIRTRSLRSLERDVQIGSDIAALFSLIRLIKRERPDIVHLNSPKAAGLGAVAARLMMVKKIIYTVHGWTFNEERPGIQKILIKFSSWITVLLTHKTICIAEGERAQIKNWKFIGGKIVMIYNGLTKIDFVDRETARNHLISKNQFLRPHVKEVWMGSIAELHPNKGLDLMLNVLHEVSIRYAGLIYVIIGEGDQREELENLIKARQLENVVYLTGFVEEARIYLKALDIFLLPSRKEGFPFAILEAGAAGLPVIASNVGGISEIIKDRETGRLVDPRDPGEISTALEQLLSDELQRERLGQNLKQKVLSDFSLDRMISQTISLYR